MQTASPDFDKCSVCVSLSPSRRLDICPSVRTCSPSMDTSSKIIALSIFALVITLAVTVYTPLAFLALALSLEVHTDLHVLIYIYISQCLRRESNHASVGTTEVTTVVED
jgi:hypothetical protein